jgi:hypothetical protein
VPALPLLLPELVEAVAPVPLLPHATTTAVQIVADIHAQVFMRSPPDGGD